MGDRFAAGWDKFASFADRHVRALAIGLAIVAVPAALLFLVPVGLQVLASPLPQAVASSASREPEAFTFLDRDGNVIGRRGPVVGRPLTLAEMPPYLPAAFLAMEDQRFWSHHGVDFIGLSRAAYVNLKEGRVAAGGSTISQQTAKLLFNRRERTIGRKLGELVHTAALEKGYSKRQILELYLNRIYLGDGAHGVDTAARTYFGTSARNVSLSQAAMLAALTRAPSVFSPRRDLARAQRRSTLVLRAMAQMGAITPAQADEAGRHLATIVARPAETRSYALDTAMDEARQLTADAGVREVLVRTSLDSGLQLRAEVIARDAVARHGKKLGFEQVAMLVMTPVGAVSAMVGGVDYSKSEFNRVTQAHRQPGSAFKPFVYLAALKAGLSPWDQREDRPVDIAGYQPANYKDAHYGRLRLADALARSVNTVAVNLAQEIGLGRVALAARLAGISSPLEANASLPLGTNEVTPLELTSAYAFFANGGHAIKPFLVASITDPATGAVLYEHKDAIGPAQMTEKQRMDMTAMLYGVVTSGTGTGARMGGREAAGKTGTSQDYRDAWFVGFTADHVATVWVGNDDNRPMRRVTGGSIPAILWRDVMMTAEANTPPKALVRTPTPPAEETDATQMGVSFVDDLAPPTPPVDRNRTYAATASVVVPRDAARNERHVSPDYAPQTPADYTPPPAAPHEPAPPPREFYSQEEPRRIPYQAYREPREQAYMEQRDEDYRYRRDDPYGDRREEAYMDRRREPYYSPPNYYSARRDSAYDYAPGGFIPRR